MVCLEVVSYITPGQGIAEDG